MHVELVVVDLDIERGHSLHEVWRPLAETIERDPDDSFAAGTHREQVRAQLAKLGLEVPTAVLGWGQAHRWMVPRRSARSEESLRGRARQGAEFLARPVRRPWRRVR